jgi:pimeloyl-ACP methyl ester carboxylesterase
MRFCERRFLTLLLLLASAVTTSACALRAGQQYLHFAAPRPIGSEETLILGFMGGRDSWNNAEVGVGRLAARLREWEIPGVYVETVENRKRDLALRLVRESLDRNADGRLQLAERLGARIILYGQSFGGAAVVRFARQLDALGIPILLTVQVDSVGRGDALIPGNVRAAANLYQDNGALIRGEAPIRATDSTRTEILGNFRFDYDNSDIDLSNLAWYKTVGRVAHARMDRDPTVWERVEALILEAL